MTPRSGEGSTAEGGARKGGESASAFASVSASLTFGHSRMGAEEGAQAEAGEGFGESPGPPSRGGWPGSDAGPVSTATAVAKRAHAGSGGGARGGNHTAAPPPPPAPSVKLLQRGGSQGGAQAPTPSDQTQMPGRWLAVCSIPSVQHILCLASIFLKDECPVPCLVSQTECQSNVRYGSSHM